MNTFFKFFAGNTEKKSQNCYKIPIRPQTLCLMHEVIPEGTYFYRKEGYIWKKRHTRRNDSLYHVANLGPSYEVVLCGIKVVSPGCVLLVITSRT